jgi:hypothetical protein
MMAASARMTKERGVLTARFSWGLASFFGNARLRRPGESASAAALGDTLI